MADAKVHNVNGTLEGQDPSTGDKTAIPLNDTDVEGRLKLVPGGAPASPENGMAWYDESAAEFRAHEDGATVALINKTGGGGGGGGGSQGFTQVSVSADHTASPFESVWANSSSVAVSVEVPAPSQSDRVSVTNVDDTNGVDLTANGSETFDGVPGPYEINGANTTVEIESDGTNWRTV